MRSCSLVCPPRRRWAVRARAAARGGPRSTSPARPGSPFDTRWTATSTPWTPLTDNCHVRQVNAPLPTPCDPTPTSTWHTPPTDNSEARMPAPPPLDRQHLHQHSGWHLVKTLSYIATPRRTATSLDIISGQHPIDNLHVCPHHREPPPPKKNKKKTQHTENSHTHATTTSSSLLTLTTAEDTTFELSTTMAMVRGEERHWWAMSKTLHGGV